MTGQPIAVATPMTDPVAATRAELRTRYARWAQLRGELAQARAELAVAISAASDAGLSYRQIGATLGAPTVTVFRLHEEGKPR